MTMKLVMYWWLAIKALGALRGALYGLWHLRGTSTVFFDIGALNGLQAKWKLPSAVGVVRSVVFEANPVAAAKLREISGNIQVVEKAIGGERRRDTLKIYHMPDLCSVREVNTAMIERYDYIDKNSGINVFSEVRRLDVELYPLEELISSGEVPAPHFLKIDVQGIELEILKGLGRHMDRVVAIELEAQFEEMYTGQALFQEVYDWMRGQGFGMLAVRPQWIMGYNVFEVNAFFARDPKRLDSTDCHRREMWCRVNRISSATLLAIRGY